MKLKQAPDDFQVEEITDVAAGSEGPFAFYQMHKSGYTTHDAITAIGKRWKLDPRRISFGGLKDRHATTSQYLTITDGPRRGLEQGSIRLLYLGQLGAPYTSEDIRCNRFRITLRDLDESCTVAVNQRLAQIARDGVPNYFDDQRFGSVNASVGTASPFMAAYLVRGQFEEALRQALAGEYAHERNAGKREKEILREHWGNWPKCVHLLPHGQARAVAAYLRNRPDDFRGAVLRLRQDLRTLYLSAFQSHLYNRVLARWLEEQVAREQLLAVSLRLGPVPFPLSLPDAVREALKTLALPLPTSRWKPAADDPRLPVVEAVLREEGLVLGDLQVRGVREMFFSRGDRAALAVVSGMQGEWGEDERQPGKKRLTLSFTLPRGSYATLVVKAIAPAE